jgi:uncharacterized protein (DUF302 family)
MDAKTRPMRGRYRNERTTIIPGWRTFRHLLSEPRAIMRGAQQRNATMFKQIERVRFLLWAAAIILALAGQARAGSEGGIVRVKSDYNFNDTITRLKSDISAKGIKFFSEIDQSKLAADAGIKLHPSTLLVFGNPPLGTQFMTSNPNSGLDWPVRLLVIQDEAGDVWTVYTDFSWIAARHGIKDRVAQFNMATTVVASITSSVKTK